MCTLKAVRVCCMNDKYAIICCMKRLGIVIAACVLALAMASAKDCNVRDFDAKGDGAAKDTATIQQAVDAVHVEFAGHCGGVRFKDCRPHLEPAGTLVLSFDDRNLDDWRKALPLFDRYDAHVTFFVYGEIDDNVVNALREFRAHGHSIGLHGRWHANADVAIAEKGAERYFADDIEPQLDRLRVAQLPFTSFAYPNCRYNDESDALFKAKGFAHVRGGHKGVAPYDPQGEKQAGLKPIHTVDRAFLPASELGTRFRLDTVIAGEAYHTDIEDILKCIRRCAERREAFVLTSHGISPGAKGINMKTEWLERILATAKDCGVAVVGFDEL